MLARRPSSSPRRSRTKGALAVALVALALSACSVDARVEVRVREDGSGVVRLTVVADADAVRAVESGGATLDTAVRLSDLTDAGFTVEPWARADDGTATLLVTHPFRNVSEVAAILADISGEDGPLRDVRVTRSRGLLSTEWSMRGRADLESVTTGVPADEALVQSLAAQGVDVTVIDQQLLAQLKASFSLVIAARLPGSTRAIEVDAKPGAVTRVAIAASVQDTTRLALLIATAVLLLLAIVFWIRGGRRRRRRPRGRPRGPAPRRPTRPAARPRPAPPRAGTPPRGPGRPRPPAPGMRPPARPAPARRPGPPPGPALPGSPARPPARRRPPPTAPPMPPSGPRPR